MRVWLPLTLGVPSKRPPKPPAPVTKPETCRVLVVDDEPSVREVASAILEESGFSVRCAEDGLAALRQVEEAAVDLVVLDMTMPGPSARENHAALRERLPEVRILLTSGYGDPQELTQLLAQPGTRFLQKPFDTQALLDEIRALRD